LDYQKLSNFKVDLFYCSVISPFAVKLFLLPFGSHCSTQNISFSDSCTSSNLGNQAPPFTGHLVLSLKIVVIWGNCQHATSHVIWHTLGLQDIVLHFAKIHCVTVYLLLLIFSSYL